MMGCKMKPCDLHVGSIIFYNGSTQLKQRKETGDWEMK